MSNPETLVCRGLEVRFGPVRAVVGADLEVTTGEILGLLGPSGCGKTTLLRCIAGFERATRGEVRLEGRVIESASLSVPAHDRGIGLVFQDYALFPHMTVAANIAYGLPRGAAAGRRVDDLLALGGIRPLRDRYPHQLSGGQQQRVAVLRSLAPRPRLILLDEPFSNLDPEKRAEMREQVAALIRAEGTTAVLVTHDRADTFAVADRVAIMEEGRILACATPEALYFKPKVEQAARFAGEVQWLPGTVRNGFVETELGLLPAAGPLLDGPCLALVRPEWVVVAREGGTAARVLERRMEGATVRCRLRLPSGMELSMVAPGGQPLGEQSCLDVAVRVAVPTFPTATPRP